MDDIPGGGTIPSNFPKKCLNFRRRGEIQTVLWGKRPKIRAERTEKRDETKKRPEEVRDQRRASEWEGER